MIVIGTVSAADIDNNTMNATSDVTAHFVNPGFESGDLNGWAAGSKTSITNNSHSGRYAVQFSNYANQSTANLTQTVDLTNVTNITFWGYGAHTIGTNYSLYVYIDNVLLKTIVPSSNVWTQYTIPTTGYDGWHNFTVTWYGACTYGALVDDFSINSPTANFTSNVAKGTVPLTIQFTDTSTDNPTSWLWDFGDGTTSTEQNPIHTYTTPGIYTIKLIATNEANHNEIADYGQITKTNYITVMNTTSPIVVVNIPGRTYNSTLNVNLTTVDPYGTTTTYYTLDGSDPQDSNTRTVYTDPIIINDSAILRYSAINSVGNWSPKYSQNYVIDTIVPTVTNNLSGGTYKTSQIVTLTVTDPNNNCTIYYTNDTTDPRNSSTRIAYKEPIIISSTTTLRYAAVDPAGNWSPLYLQNYVIGTGTIANSTGQSPYVGPQNGTVLWTYTSNNGMSGVTIGSDGTLYVGSCGSGYSGGLYVLNPDGSLKWNYTTNGGITGVALGNDGTLYAGSIWGFVYAFNPNGTVNWIYDTGDQPRNIWSRTLSVPPVVSADGTIYIGLGNGEQLIALNPNGKLKWQVNIGTVWSTPVIGTDGTIYVANAFGRMYAVNPDGTYKWVYRTEWMIGGFTLGSDGIIYVGDRKNNLYALTLDGSLKWKYIASSEIWNAPAIGSDGTIYFTTQDNSAGSDDRRTLYALTSEGELKWKYKTEGYMTGITIGSDGTIYVGVGNGGSIQNGKVIPNTPGLYAFNPNGTVKWIFQNHPGGSIIGSDGTLYLASGNSVYAIKDLAPVADFTANNTNVLTSQTVQFTDESVNNVTSWAWDFNNDGIIDSTLQNPTYTYTNPSKYTVKLKVTGNGGSDEEVKTSYVTVNAPDTTAPIVKANLVSGTYNTAKTVKLTTTDDNSATTYYTLDGSDPKTSSTKLEYLNPIVINSTSMLKFAAIDAANNWSPTYNETYTIIPTVNVNLAGGNYYIPQNVVLDASETSDIYYTLDGSDPIKNSAKYSGPINILTSKTLKFFAVDAAGNQSRIYTEKYFIYAWTPYSYPVTIQYRLSNKKYRIKYRVAYKVKKKVRYKVGKKWQYKRTYVTKYKWAYKWDYRYGYRTETRWTNHWVLT
jgi:PKD repeat protein